MEGTQNNEELHDLVAAIDELQIQFRIWHWNTRDFIHLATEEVYKGLTDPLDGLAESYRVISGQKYNRKNEGEFITEWSAEAMNKICKGTIDTLNKVAHDFSDEGLNGYIGDCIQILRTVMYKIG